MCGYPKDGYIDTYTLLFIHQSIHVEKSTGKLFQFIACLMDYPQAVRKEVWPTQYAAFIVVGVIITLTVFAF